MTSSRRGFLKGAAALLASTAMPAAVVSPVYGRSPAMAVLPDIEQLRRLTIALSDPYWQRLNQQISDTIVYGSGIVEQPNCADVRFFVGGHDVDDGYVPFVTVNLFDEAAEPV